jgi:hypothetical protein
MRRGLLVALAVIAAVNLGVTLDVLRDRAGEPDAVVTLDERELALESQPREGSAITLRWRYQREGRPGGDAPIFLPDWIDQRKLETLGFDCSVPAGAPGAAEHYGGMPSRRVVLVFEIGGPAWQARLERWQQRSREDVPHLISTGGLKPDEEVTYREAIDRASERVSRLMPVDVGLDAPSLRTRYPDRGRYLLLPGLVRLSRDKGTGGAGVSVFGRVAEVLPAELSVPREVHDALERLAPTDVALPPGVTKQRWSPDRHSVERIAHAPRYAVHVEVGALLRPRIVSITSIEPGR